MANNNVLEPSGLTLSSSAKGTIPSPLTANGTYNTTGIYVAGVGAASATLRDKLVVGDYLYSSTLNQLRKVSGFSSKSGYAVLESSFTSNVSGDALQWCRPLYRSVVVNNTGASTGSVKNNGIQITTGQIQSFENDYGVSPMTYATSSTTFTITYGY